MQQEIIGIVNSFQQTALDASKQLVDINSRACEKLVQKQLAVAELCLAGSVKQMDLVREFKDVAGYWSAQNEFVKDYAGKAMAVTKETVGILSGARDELASWFEKGVAQATEKVAPVSTKKAA